MSLLGAGAATAMSEAFDKPALPIERPELSNVLFILWERLPDGGGPGGGGGRGMPGSHAPFEGLCDLSSLSLE